MAGFKSLFGRKDNGSTSISTASTSSNKRGVSVGRNGGMPASSGYAHSSLPPPNERSHSHSGPQPRTTTSTAPTSCNKPWVSVGENGGISTFSEYAHPVSLSPPKKRPERYHRIQPPKPHLGHRPEQSLAHGRSTPLSVEPLPSLGHVMNRYQDSTKVPKAPVSPISTGVSAWGQNQGVTSNLPPSPVSPMEKQWPEFPSHNKYRQGRR